MNAVHKTYEMDMCNGPVFSKLVIFSIPVILSGILQLLFNAADVIVVGHFAGSESLAAVGSTTSLINLLINLFIGLSVGANVLVAQTYGAQKYRDLEDTVQTAMMMAVVGGFILLAVGECLSGPILTLMGTPDNVLPLSAIYMKMYFLGMPATIVYNFGSAILRAVGDTKRPLYYLIAAGILNVSLNLFFVIGCHMGVAGVGLATSISQYVSATLIIRCLTHTDGPYRVDMKKLRIVPQKAALIAHVGIPAGLQGIVFSISNVLIQSSINSFGSTAMAGSTAASNIEGFVYNAMNGVYQTTLSFSSQNYGARKYGRMTKILIYCLGLVTLIGVVLGGGAYLMGRQLLRVYSSDLRVIEYGMLRLKYLCSVYFLCGLMDTMVGGIRGMGYSVMPMIVSLTGACLMRVVWIFTIFQVIHTLDILYLSYPVTWVITFLAHVVCYLMARRKLARKLAAAM
ncbi:MAG: MATE family efflux transporter [Clostridiales bacterium]|nr:MATE family efflux transporter [Clostridiales bacterium]